MSGEAIIREPFDRSILYGGNVSTEDYYRDRLENIEAGEPTWLKTSKNDPDTPDEFDFYNEGQLIGSVSHIGWPYCSSRAYSYRTDSELAFVTLQQAVEFVEDQVAA